MNPAAEAGCVEKLPVKQKDRNFHTPNREDVKELGNEENLEGIEHPCLKRSSAYLAYLHKTHLEFGGELRKRATNATGHCANYASDSIKKSVQLVARWQSSSDDPWDRLKPM